MRDVAELDRSDITGRRWSGQEQGGRVRESKEEKAISEQAAVRATPQDKLKTIDKVLKETGACAQSRSRSRAVGEGGKREHATHHRLGQPCRWGLSGGAPSPGARSPPISHFLIPVELLFETP